MANGSKLLVVRSMVKSERGISLNTNATAQDTEINQIIFDVQQDYAQGYDWSFLKTRWTAQIAAGTGGRYTTFPTTSDLGVTTSPNMERPILCMTKWNQIWQPVIYGISEESEFNYLDSDRGQVLDPIQRWMFSDVSKFEIWPLSPAGATLRFVGQRVLTELRSSFSTLPITWNDNALLDLDDVLVSLTAAAKYAARQNQKDLAGVLMGEAQKRLTTLRGGYENRTQPMIMGRGVPFDRKAIRQVPLVLIAGK